jgi:hypothetical protein
MRATPRHTARLEIRDSGSPFQRRFPNAKRRARGVQCVADCTNYQAGSTVDIWNRLSQYRDCFLMMGALNFPRGFATHPRVNEGCAGCSPHCTCSSYQRASPTRFLTPTFR